MSPSPPSQDWMVLQCTSCQSRMKVRRETALSSRLLCPHCHTPVPVQGDPATAAAAPRGGDAGEFRPSALPERPAADPSRAPLPLREGPVMQGRDFASAPREEAPHTSRPAAVHPEFDGNLPHDSRADGGPDEDEEGDEDEDGDRHVPPEQRRRVRIKKRKTKRPSALRYLELTDWDQSDLTQIREAEISADIWAEIRPLPEDVYQKDEENEYVVESTDDEDGQTKTTKKKVRRRRLLQGARLFFQRFTWLSRHFTTALAVLVGLVAVYGFYVFNQKYSAPALPPVADAPIDRAVLTSYDELGAEKAVRDFLAADGIEAKLAFVRQPDRIRPLMKSWYRGERTAAPLQAGEVTMRDKRGGEYGSSAYYVILALPVLYPDPLNPGNTYDEQTFFAVEEIRKGPDSTYLVDWETSTGYQEMPLETYKATMPPEPWPFRIYMKADNYYNHGFNELEWQCVSLYYPGRDFSLYGYISRLSPEGRDLLPLVEDGRRAGIIAELVYPQEAASRDQVIVKRMVHPSWFYDKAEDAAKFGDAITPAKSN